MHLGYSESELSDQEKAMRVGICYNIDYVPEVHGSPQEYFNEILAQVDILE